MSPTSLSALPPASAAICIFLVVLVPLAAAGIALMNTGLGRARSAAHAMLTSLCLIAVAALVYFFVGFAWQGTAGRTAHFLMIAGKPWGWIGAERFFLRSVPFDGSPVSLVAALQVFSVGIAALIPLGSANERWRLGAACASTALLSGFTYPIFAHWAWGGGWLAQLGINHGLGLGFLDAGGSGCIQAVGGITALAIAWIIGPRHAKYAASAMPAAIPAHNAVFVLLGCFFCWLGWLGLNGAGAILFAGAELARLPLIVVNTTLSACAALLMAVIITGVRFGKPDASLSANAWLGGLVASSAASPFMPPAAATAVGLAAGALVPLSVEWLEFKLGVDDPGGSISAHGVAGIWGLLAAGLFAVPTNSHQWLAQVIGVATLLGFVLPLTYGTNWILNRFYPHRVSRDGEQEGMDLLELGADAYPEFVIHAESLLPH
jgi:ammonium transporter, Amt family